MSGLPSVYLGLGSNLGNRERNLWLALRRLEPLVRIEDVSSLYETDPVGIEDQPAFLNAVCRTVTGLQPKALLRHIQDVEHEIGRRGGERWGPRPIDIDLLLYGDTVTNDNGVVVPHPEMAARAFVLVPLAEIAPDVVHPALGKDARSLVKEIDASGVRVRANRGWEAR
jgi:2-amino-4-hydroxy-6-hydroxymethyldihydropteridine diphosphokinase